MRALGGRQSFSDQSRLSFLDQEKEVAFFVFFGMHRISGQFREIVEVSGGLSTLPNDAKDLTGTKLLERPLGV